MTEIEEADPPAVTVVNETGSSPYVLLCEHASRYIPARYAKLGLPDKELTRHIAWDIGAAGIGQGLSKALDAPLFMSGYSRLLIDCNRPLGVPSSIPEISESTLIPGNVGLDDAERKYRADAFYWPFQRAVRAHIDQRIEIGRPTIIFGVHTFTPIYKGYVRPWHAGVLYRRSAVFGERLLAELAEPGLTLAANEPYKIEDDHDQTVPVHGEKRGLDAVLIEVRQDLVGDEMGEAAWAARLAQALEALI
ncbi:MAG: N-formylglutamate amidohydrolase [Hyphomicrobiaceae bacterium]